MHSLQSPGKPGLTDDVPPFAEVIRKMKKHDKLLILVDRKRSAGLPSDTVLDETDLKESGLGFKFLVKQ